MAGTDDLKLLKFCISLADACEFLLTKTPTVDVATASLLRDEVRAARAAAMSVDRGALQRPTAKKGKGK